MVTVSRSNDEEAHPSAATNTVAHNALTAGGLLSVYYSHTAPSVADGPHSRSTNPSGRSDCPSSKDSLIFFNHGKGEGPI